MKKIMVLLFIVLGIFSYGKSLENIENLTLNVKEKVLLNGESKESKYRLKYIYPNFVRKEILEPELNKGEIYIYNGTKKIVYLPLFNQKNEEVVSPDENEVLRTINYILDKIKSDEKFKQGYYSKKIDKINLDNGVIKIENLKEYDGYLLPSLIKIIDGDTEIGELEIENYNVNSDFNIEELSQI